MRIVTLACLVGLVGCSNAITNPPGDRASSSGSGSTSASSSGSGSTGASSSGSGSTGASSSGSGSTGVGSGFIFNGPLDAGPAGSGMAYTLLHAGDAGGPSGASVGSPCQIASDCGALGPESACFHADGGGFCTLDCSNDPESGRLCPGGTHCFFGLAQAGAGGRICLQPCVTPSDCSGGFVCSAALYTFNAPDSGFIQHVCLPPCASDADCNHDVSGLVCDSTTHTCSDPGAVVGSACTDNADCLGMGPGGACMHSARDPTKGYCTTACDPAASSPCEPGTSGFGEGREVTCVAGYATLTDGGPVSVCLGDCSSDAECKTASANACDYFPDLETSLCAVACSADADCPDGRCDTATGNCQTDVFFSPECAADSNCTGGLCVTDFHLAEHHNCSQRCTSDASCPAGSVCVSSLVSKDGAGESLAPALTLDGGFCAPSCTGDGGACADPTTHCIAPVAVPEIDFRGNGAASGWFCWR